jgi:hypothetical protein
MSPPAAGYSSGKPTKEVAMDTELWTFRVDVLEPTATMPDLTGYKVEARDGSIGKVDEATNETGRSWLVVDIGPWIFGRKVMIPAGTITKVDRENKRVFVSLTKNQIKDSPEFDESRFDDDYRTRLGEYYDRTGWTHAA